MGIFEHFPYTNFHDMNDAWVLQTVKECKAAVDDMEAWKTQHQEEYQELKDFMDDIEAGNFPPSMYDAMRTWLETNAFNIIGEMIKHVYFGLDDNGHFIVTIPQNWAELVFKTTGYDFNTPLQPEFGHLCLLY